MATDSSSSVAPTPGVSSARALSLFASLDRQKTGILKQADFLALYAAMAPTSTAQTVEKPAFAGQATQFKYVHTSFNIVSSFGVSWSTVKAHAERSFNALDTDHSGLIDKAKFMAHFGFDLNGVPLTDSPSTSPSSSPGSPSTTTNSDANSTAPDVSQQADHVLSTYDRAGKGYFDAQDVATVFSNNPALGDPLAAHDVVAAWDDDQDGKVTRDELINGFTTLNLADAIMAQFDPLATGKITLADVGTNTLPSLSNASETLASWDTNKDGFVTRDDVIAGIRHLNTAPAPKPVSDDPAALFKTYDANGDNTITADEIASNSPSTGDPSSIMAAWDTNADGSISQTEFTDGLALIKQATGIVSHYDSGGKGWFDQSDLQAAIESNPANSGGPTAADLMAFWDANGDGKVTVPDVLAGLAQGGQVATPDTPTVDPDNLAKLYAAYGYSTTTPSGA